MCTVSWLHDPDGYHLLCNRDEKRTRGRALSPRIEWYGGVRFIAPTDADFGGTWIAVNEFGVSICLLNGGTGLPAAEPRESRGLLIRELIWARSADDCAFLLNHFDLAPYAPFTVVFLEPVRPAIVAAWDGENTSVTASVDSPMLLTSSSYDPDGVRRSRLDEFARRAGGAASVAPALLYEFQSSHGRQPDAYSPCMHRADAETVSFSWVAVTRDQIRFFYSPTAPCRRSSGEQQLLARAA